MLVSSMAQYDTKSQHDLASIRDTVQSIWVAIVLAFVLRAFVVEAFVIPTGSMAPRLYGEHLDLKCPACGKEFAFGWSVSQERNVRREIGGVPANGRRKPEGAVCPSCGYALHKEADISGGDRVLVMKYLYRFRPPKPWDVIVFKNPQDNQQNYIKRLIGLPGETIEIVHGDVFVCQPGEELFRIRRKEDPRVQNAMWQVVFDNDFRPDYDLIEKANRLRRPGSKIKPCQWRLSDPNDGRWKLADNAESQYGRVFRFAGKGGAGGKAIPAWLELEADDGRFLPHYGYDRGSEANGITDIVSDLKLEGVWQPADKDSHLALSLSSFEFVFTAHISGDGSVRLLCRPAEGDGSGESRLVAPAAKIASLADGRGHVVSIRNVDLRASVWIDGQCVTESLDTEPDEAAGDQMKYPMDYKWLKHRLMLAHKSVDAKAIPEPTVRIAASGSDSVLQHIKLMRDVFYTSPRISRGSGEGSVLDFADRLGVQSGARGWGTEGNPITLRTFDDSDLNQYFVMGDNSPSSLDGRLWTAAAPTLRLYDDSGLRGDPNLAIGDMDWPRFWGILRQRTGDASSAGAYILSRLSAEVQEQVKQLSPSELRHQYTEDYADESLDLLRTKIVGELNDMIGAPGLYDPKAWLSWGVMLPDVAGRLVQKQAGGEKLSPQEMARLNRLALQAAMPKAISSQWRTYQLGTVPQYSMIGKAIFVYWPSGFRVPGLSGLPIIPNVGRMRLIR